MVEIITIGDEILIGQIVDTNSAWMAVELNKIGLSVSKITTVSDNSIEISAAIDCALAKNQIVLITGGIGPTKDDVTKNTLCHYFDTELVFDKRVLENIENLFKNRSLVINELTKAQALVPKSCTVIQNRVGTAPITWFDKDEKIVVSMPGVPFEMKRTMSDDILPRLKERFNSTTVIHKTLQVYGYGESALAIKIEDWENKLPHFVSLAYLPSFGLVKLRLSGKLDDKQLLQIEIDKQISQLREILGNAIIAENDLTLEENVGIALRKQNKFIATAESCTGGNIAHKISSIAGSSDYFLGSVVAYDNSVKTNILKVDEVDLQNYGAVSKEVVEQMANGLRNLTNSDFAISTSGIAGPSGGTDEKPVGTVWIALSSADFTISKRFAFGNYSRENIIERSTMAALIMLLESLNG